jgi:hypothetical protein
MNKIILYFLILALFSACNKKKSEEVVSTQNAVIDKATGGLTAEQQANREWAHDLDKKQNFSGKVLGLSYLENHKVKVKALSVSSKTVEGIVFSNELILLKKRKVNKLPYLEINSEDKKVKKTLKLLFDWNKEKDKCFLRSQFVAKDVVVMKDPYPLAVNSKYCSKYYKAIGQ